MKNAIDSSEVRKKRPKSFTYTIMEYQINAATPTIEQLNNISGKGLLFNSEEYKLVNNNKHYGLL